MTKDEALRLALEALQFALHVGFDESSESQIKKGAKAGQQHRQAITAIKAALEAKDEPEQMAKLGWQVIDCPICGGGARAFPKQEAKDEPVAWRTFDGEGGYDYRTYDMNENYANEWNERHPKHNGWVEPLYTTPPPRTWVGLTDEEKHSAAWSNGEFGDGVLWAEKLLKERNT